MSLSEKIKKLSHIKKVFNSLSRFCEFFFLKKNNSLSHAQKKVQLCVLYLLEKSSIRVIFDGSILWVTFQKKGPILWLIFRKIKDLLFEYIFKAKFSNFQKLIKFLELHFLKMFNSLNHMKNCSVNHIQKSVQILLSHMREKRVFNSLSHVRKKKGFTILWVI